MGFKGVGVSAQVESLEDYNTVLNVCGDIYSLVALQSYIPLTTALEGSWPLEAASRGLELHRCLTLH